MASACTRINGILKMGQAEISGTLCGQVQSNLKKTGCAKDEVKIFNPATKFSSECVPKSTLEKYRRNGGVLVIRQKADSLEEAIKKVHEKVSDRLFSRAPWWRGGPTAIGKTDPIFTEIFENTGIHPIIEVPSEQGYSPLIKNNALKDSDVKGFSNYSLNVYLYDSQTQILYRFHNVAINVHATFGDWEAGLQYLEEQIKAGKGERKLKKWERPFQPRTLDRETLQQLAQQILSERRIILGRKDVPL